MNPERGKTLKRYSDFTLLFADDDPSIRAIYSKSFTKEGYRVLTCDNASQVMAELNEQKVDLLVTDLEMPKANTLDLFPALKKAYPRLPVVVVTGHYQGMKEEFLSKGYNVTAFLNKPAETSVLKIVIKDILKVESN
jgi:DNA-binding NtrC family response regulator